MLKAHIDVGAFDFSELDKKRPALEIRRRTVQILTRSLLVEKGFLSFEHAQTVEIHRLKSGKPFLKSTQNINHLLPSISISHSRSWIACLLSDNKAPACLDIEDITANRAYKKLSAYAFSKEENQFVLQTGQLGFYKLWTAKEAIAKCSGKGLSHALKIDLSFQLANSVLNTPIVVKTEDGNYQILQQIADDDLLVSIAKKAVLSVRAAYDHSH
ncbi:MAG TPA: 4'-phosphopantetheinyl transferase superfamily protein [Alphaproteobacteria bacterium]|nr:4'-phosphopantetheinyl transferase superfamily protein [Alphaproteobacteria bacterium]